MKKIITVIGARPQFIKVAVVSRVIKDNFEELIIHTGQHYDYNMNKLFFEELEIPEPIYNLNIGSMNHGAQTGRMLEGIENILLEVRPDLVLLYGDTNSTIAGALAAAKHNIPVAHVEAGLRSYNRSMPEEINRVLTDSLSEFLFVPCENAVNNLHKEGITRNIYNVGDVMYDAILYYSKQNKKYSGIIGDILLKSEKYYLVTCHRPANTDDPDNMKIILDSLENLDLTCVFPIHPRTKNLLVNYKVDLSSFKNIRFLDPVGYLENINLLANCKKLITDSGGMQKEAFFLKKPCITIRNETEWIETVECGWNHLVEINKALIIETIIKIEPKECNYIYPYGDGQASEKICEILEKNL